MLQSHYLAILRRQTDMNGLEIPPYYSLNLQLRDVRDYSYIPLSFQLIIL